jgi:sialic acid synthase SpsE
VKRPGTGEIKAVHYYKLLGKTAGTDIPKDKQLKWTDVVEDIEK